MTDQMLNAALAGFGMACIPEDLAEPHLAAFALLVDALRYRD